MCAFVAPPSLAFASASASFEFTLGSVDPGIRKTRKMPLGSALHYDVSACLVRTCNSLLIRLARSASAAPFLCRIFDQRLWPDRAIVEVDSGRSTAVRRHGLMQRARDGPATHVEADPKTENREREDMWRVCI
jgi:hypothetical protein